MAPFLLLSMQAVGLHKCALPKGSVRIRFGGEPGQQEFRCNRIAGNCRLNKGWLAAGTARRGWIGRLRLSPACTGRTSRLKPSRWRATPAGLRSLTRPARPVPPKLRRRAEEQAFPAPTKEHPRDRGTRPIAVETYARWGSSSHSPSPVVLRLAAAGWVKPCKRGSDPNRCCLVAVPGFLGRGQHVPGKFHALLRT